MKKRGGGYGAAPTWWHPPRREQKKKLFPHIVASDTRNRRHAFLSGAVKWLQFMVKKANAYDSNKFFGCGEMLLSNEVVKIVSNKTDS